MPIVHSNHLENPVEQNSSSLTLGDVTTWQQQSINNDTVTGYIRNAQHIQEQEVSSLPPIHFLHGTGFTAMTLAPMAASLPKDWELWFTDVPGHGRSSQPNHRMPDWQDMADTVAQSIINQSKDKQAQKKQSQHQPTSHPFQPFIGVGHSMGGVLTLLAAAKHPKLFKRIVLLDPVLFNTEIIIAQHLMRSTGAWKKSSLVRSVSRRTASWPTKEVMLKELKGKQLYRQWHHDALSAFADYGTHTDNNDNIALSCAPRWEGSIFGSYPKGLWQSVRKIDIPVDIIIAEKSYPFIPRAAKKAARINSNIQWHTFGKRHCFPMEEPEAAAKFIQQLLTK